VSLRLYLEIMRSLGIREPDPPSGLGRVVEGLPSWFDVSGLAEASIAAAAVQVAAISDLGPQNVNVDRRLCGLWFGWSLRPQGWVMPNPWDPIAGDYKARGGWTVALLTNSRWLQKSRVCRVVQRGRMIDRQTVPRLSTSRSPR
jgi:hypothetical protein